MPTYALLGATGATGAAILRCLLADPPADLTLNIFVRSKSKLLNAFPDLRQDPSAASALPFRINIFEGSIGDIDAVKPCLSGADTIFMCVATNISTPGNRLCQDIVTTILESLRSLKTEYQQQQQQQRRSKPYTTPSLLLLRSSSQNPALNTDIPWLALYLLNFAEYYVYNDIRLAAQQIESAVNTDPDLVRLILVDPPAIHDANGEQRTGHRLTQRAKEMSGGINYADLGAGFVEVAVRKAEFHGQAVGVAATGEVRTHIWTLFRYLAWGVKCRIFG